MITGILPQGILCCSFLHIADRYTDANWHVNFSKHPFHNFMFTVSGEGSLITKDKIVPMSKNMLVYHKKDSSFGFRTNIDNPMHCFGINFNVMNLLPDKKWSISPIDELPFEKITYINQPEKIIESFKEMARIDQTQQTNKQVILNSLFQLSLYEIATNILSQNTKTSSIHRMENIKIYIDNHYMENITLTDLAKNVRLNPNYLSEIFKRYTNMTPIQYLHFTRCEKAKKYLDNGDFVYEAANKVGFHDPFYFSKVFKKQMGISPKEYAKSPSFF